MSVRTNQEIRDQIEGLEQEKQVTEIGSTLRMGYVAQIAILEGTETSDSFDDMDPIIMLAAIDAESWLSGRRKENLFD